MSDCQTSYSWLTVITAWGVGTIIAAVVGFLSAKAVAISTHRQNWINGLSDELIVLLKEIDNLHYVITKLFKDGAVYSDEDDEKRRIARVNVLEAKRRILLRLNMTEEISIKLTTQLEDLMTIDSTTINQDKVDALIITARELLK